eukprot:3939058-Rhodomonas_salina.4
MSTHSFLYCENTENEFGGYLYFSLLRKRSGRPNQHADRAPVWEKTRLFRSAGARSALNEHSVPCSDGVILSAIS